MSVSTLKDSFSLHLMLRELMCVQLAGGVWASGSIHVV